MPYWVRGYWWAKGYVYGWMGQAGILELKSKIKIRRPASALGVP